LRNCNGLRNCKGRLGFGGDPDLPRGQSKYARAAERRPHERGDNRDP
jgi:hypothetical protein